MSLEKLRPAIGGEMYVVGKIIHSGKQSLLSVLTLPSVLVFSTSQGAATASMRKLLLAVQLQGEQLGVHDSKAPAIRRRK